LKSWCLAEDYGNGDQHCPMGPHGLGRLYFFMIEELTRIIEIAVTVLFSAISAITLFVKTSTL